MKVLNILSWVLFFYINVSLLAQTLLDDFNRTDNTTVGNSWSETETAASGAEINGNQLQMNTNSNAGREWIFQDVQASYETVFDNNTSNLVWYFNVRQSNTTPSGFDNGRYAAMVVLGASTSDYSTANGYGVAVGKQGGNFPLRLLRFDGGFDVNSNITELISAGDYGTDYLSIKVVFNPPSGIWTLYAESNASSFSNPTTVTTQVGQPVVDVNNTGMDLIYFGAFYNHNNNASSNAFFDNFYLPGSASSNTSVQFVASQSNINESGGSTTINVSINNPDATNATMVDVALTGGTATNGTDNQTYTTQSLTFPAGSSANQSISVTINEDADIEATETLVFQLQNVSGGNSAGIALPSQHTLSIVDNEVYALMISEVADPSDNAQAAFVELYNNEGSTIDFSTQTWYLSIQTDGHPNKWNDIQLTGSVAAGELYLLANNQTVFLNSFGFTPDFANSNINGDGNDSYLLYYGGDHTTGTLVEIYGVENQNGLGQAWEYTDGHAERNAGVNSTNSTWNNSEWTITTPVTISGLNPSDTFLPIELVSFTATGDDKKVILRWITASEIDNLGFILARANKKDGPYKEIASYKYNPELSGKGNSSHDNYYMYTDYSVLNDIIYWYKLFDVDLNGVITEHNIVYAMPNNNNIKIDPRPGDLPKTFTLYQNYPNPFNPGTKIRFDIPDMRTGVINVSLIIYNLSGQKVRTLIMTGLIPGTYQMGWDGTDDNGRKLSSGIYIYNLNTEYFQTAKRMLIIH